GRLPIMYLILSMTMFPAVAILGALFALISQFGLYNTLPALILTYLVFTLPFTVWVLTSFFQAMPKDLEEAAYVDGATAMETLYKVMLPLIAPGMVTTGLLAFIGAWNEFLFALSFTQTPDKYTVPIALLNFTTTTGGGFEIPWGPMMAATIVVTVPLIALTLIFQRRILGGLTAGAVKG
ncbi:MAG: carbohydrate ABC transporter permease, partial [Chloroflexota bacterium]|nr:carbohydrate ABC transporter permease [Chloroflexota bacterium]